MPKVEVIDSRSTDANQHQSHLATSRRMLTFGLPAAAIAGLIATSPAASAAERGPNNPDAELIRLCDIVVAGQRELEASNERYADEINQPSEEEQARNRMLVEQGHELSEQIADMRATTLEGFRAKAAAMLTYTGHYVNGEPIWTNHDELLGWSLARDLVGQDRV